MPITATDRAGLIELLAANMPATTLIEVVREQQVMQDFDIVRKQAPDDPTEARRYIAGRVVTAYESKGMLTQLARALYRRTYLDDVVAPLLKGLISLEAAEGADEAQQAAIVVRANTMSQRRLREFLAATESRICVVVAENNNPAAGKVGASLGTGFLVGPDLVLTAYHTLRKHITGGEAVAPPPGPCYALFDYYDGGPLTDPIAVPSGSIRVPFAERWLVTCNEDMPGDGTFRQPSAAQAELLPTRLDFALIRLARPVGKLPRQSTGGARRSWVKLSPPLALRDADRVIIPQHPNGLAQRIDFGRYSEPDSELDPSGTRMRYDTESDRGTSGAPCFNQNFALVGMHNAAFQPDGVVVEKNQAIRLDRILAVLDTVPEIAAAAAAVEAEPVRLWNTSPGPDPRVILGRDTLLDWITQAAAEESRSPAERVYAAYVRAEDAPRNSGFGKSFTTEVLGAARRGTGEPVVVLGTKDNLLPDTVPDFVRAIGYQLGMDKSIFDTMPPRPAADLPVGAPNADKLHKWASEDVPAWFDVQLAEFRERVVDLRLDAQRRIEALKSLGIDPSAEDVRIASQLQAVPDTRRRWPIAWIVLDGLLTTRMSDEVRDVIAGMVGGKVAEASMPQQLRRLRWLFLGYVPDFVSAEHVTSELLDPRSIDGVALVRAIALLADSMVYTLGPDVVEIAELITDVLIENIGNAAVEDPTSRLRVFQERIFPVLAGRIAELLRRRGS